MEILTLYVGQGECALVRHQHEAIVIDTRWPEDLADKLSHKVELFVGQHDLVGIVLTGFDRDHADPIGLDYLLEQYKPNWVMYPKYYKDTNNATDVFNVIRKHERRRQETSQPLEKVSVRLDRLDSRYLDDLSVCFNYELFSPHIEDMDNSNNCSIVLKLEGLGAGGFAYLITGDTENERWETITRLFGSNLSSDVLSAPHHGSKNASHPKMALQVSPNTVLISAGVNNQYGHPDVQAVRIYQRVAEHVFQTNVEGGVSLHTEPNGRDFLTRLVR